MRVRDIIHGSGSRIRLVLNQGQAGEGPVIRLSDPDRPGTAAVLLDLYGGELLAGFLMSARLSDAGELADEGSTGDAPIRLRLVAVGDRPVIIIDQAGTEMSLVQPLWDRLYTELLLVIAHGRNIDHAGFARTRAGVESGRLLH